MKDIFELSALILGLVNGFFLLFLSLRNRPILKAYPVLPDSIRYFQADYIEDDKNTPIYGFLAHMRVINKGNKDISIFTWNLAITTPKGKRVIEPISIPSAKVKMGNVIREINAFGLGNNNRVKAGDEISGIVCYLSLDKPQYFESQKVKGQFQVTPVYGRKVNCNLTFEKVHYKAITDVIPEFESIMKYYIQRLK